MIRIILALNLLSLLDINHHVGGQDLKAKTSMTSTTSNSVVARTENTTTIKTSGKDGKDDNVDFFQDILFDPSLIVTRLNRDVNNKESIMSTDLRNVKNKHSSNVEEDLKMEENKRYSASYWYQRQNWQVDKQKPTFKHESYRRFLKYPIFSGR